MITRAVITRRWAPEILVALADGPRLFSELQKIAGINDKTLFIRLIELIDRGLIARVVDVGRPVRVSYELTEPGRKFVPLLQKLALQEVAGQVS